MSSNNWLTQWVWDGLDWLYPPLCGGCGRKGFHWCPDCQQQVKLIPEPVCRTCGLPLSRPGQCAACRKVDPPLERVRSWAVYQGSIRHALLELKYRRNVALAHAMTGQFSAFVGTLGWKVDMVVPVPLGKIRRKERGFNQVDLLAEQLAGKFKWKVVHRALIRIEETRSQVGLTIDERRENVIGAFQADPSLVSKAEVLLIDDICTTGATLHACASALSEAGAESVCALTVARAFSYNGLKNY